jgi:hypothetical protein
MGVGIREQPGHDGLGKGCERQGKGGEEHTRYFPVEIEGKENRDETAPATFYSA